MMKCRMDKNGNFGMKGNLELVIEPIKWRLRQNWTE